MLFFSRSSIVSVDERKKPSSRVRAIIIRILLEKEKLIVFCTSTDCTSFIVSFTGPVTSATEIAFAIKRLLLLLLLVLDFFLNFKVVGEEMNRARGRHHGHHFLFVFFLVSRFCVKSGFWCGVICILLYIVFVICALRVIFERELIRHLQPLYTSQI